MRISADIADIGYLIYVLNLSILITYMKKVFILGEQSVNDEIKSFLGTSCDIVPELNNATDIIIDSTNFPAERKIENIKFADDNSNTGIPYFTSSLCISVSEQASYSKYPARIIGIGLYNTFSNSKLVEIAPSKITDIKILENAESFMKEINANYVNVPDKAGLVFPRILSMIINEAAQVYSDNVASRDDIDTAMKLGTNYPYGPLEWADKLGIDLFYNILTALQRDFGEDRYRPHPSLKEMVNLNMLGIKTGKGFYNH
jgi:3-hydroxybutyryl-CoA dehydrogenase